MHTQFWKVFVVTAAILVAGCARQPSPAAPEPESSSSDGYLLHPSEAETLLGDKGRVTIIASPATGSPHFAMGTQQLQPNNSIPVHRHEHADEAIFIHGGSGFGVLGDKRSIISKGDAVYIPRGVWHAFETGTEELDIVWFIAPPGLEEFFRETRVVPGTPLRSLTPEQMEQIGLKHGIRNKPQ